MTRPFPAAARARLLCAAVAVVACTAATPAHAGPGLERVLAVELPAALRTAAADEGESNDVQARYEAARALESRLPAAVGRDCRPLLAALRRFAAAQVAAAEWFDRKQPARRAAASKRGRRARGEIERVRGACASAEPVPARSKAIEPVTPGDGEAFTGEVVVRLPRTAESVELRADGVVAATGAVTGATARLRVAGRARPIGLLEARIRDAHGAVVGVVRARRVFLLPPTAWDAGNVARADGALAARLAALAAGFAGVSALWLADLAGGARAGWNERAPFPAASTVKLGVLAAALARLRVPDRLGRVGHDLEAIASWSSNLAANRLVRLVGGGDAVRGSAAVERMLQRLGASASTYTGDYRVGTSRAAVPTEPPRVSHRVTTARDLGAVLETLNRLAGGDAGLERRTGLRPRDARLVIGLLLRSRAAGDNAGLLAPFLPASLPRASKQGWISSARHTAALLYGPGGPVVVVLLTYREGLTLREARALGSGVARLATARAAP